MKSRLGGRERDVVGHDRLRETLEGERADLFGLRRSLQRDIDEFLTAACRLSSIARKSALAGIAHQATSHPMRSRGLISCLR